MPVQMMTHDNQYAAFLADFAAGTLSGGELLAAELHFALSKTGAQSRRMMEAAGGALLEGARPQAVAFASPEPAAECETDGARDWVRFYSQDDLMALRWRRSLFGVKTLPTHLASASLLRLDPGERAPRHNHDGPDVTVVLRGAFADDWGEYHRGDLAFADAGDKHAPATVGDETCVCLVATPNGRPTVDLRALVAGWWKRRGDGH